MSDAATAFARALAWALACGAPGAPGAAAAATQVENAWMRPAAAGAAAAEAYADLRNDAPLTLVAVRTPVARAVEIVVRDRPGDIADPPRVVASLAIPAGETRFAMRGSVLRLVGVTQAVLPGTSVPLAFEFRDARGAKTVVETLVQVRGLFVPQPAAPPPAAPR